MLLGAITTLGGGDLYQGYLFTLAAIVVSGVLMILLGFLKMGRLADFFPASAIEGMLAAIGLGILAKQFHIMIGHNNESGSIISLLGKIPSGLYRLYENANPEILVAAAIGIIALLIMIYYSKIRNKYFHLIPAPMWILILAIGFSYVMAALDIPYPMSSKFLVNIQMIFLRNGLFLIFPLSRKKNLSL